MLIRKETFVLISKVAYISVTQCMQYWYVWEPKILTYAYCIELAFIKKK